MGYQARWLRPAVDSGITLIAGSGHWRLSDLATRIEVSGVTVGHAYYHYYYRFSCS